MKLLRVLLQTSPVQFALTVCVGLVAGASGAALIAAATRLLAGHSAHAVWVFAALCVAYATARCAFYIIADRLSLNVVFSLRMRLSRQIIAAPLRRLEELGIANLLSILTNDVATLSTCFSNLAIGVINGLTILGGMVYLLFLSPVSAVLFVISLIPTVAIQLVMRRLTARSMLSWRDEQDRLFERFRGLTEGAKELRLNAERSRQFYSQSLEPTAKAHRRFQEMTGIRVDIGSSLALLCFFGFIGIVLSLDSIDIYRKTETVLLLLFLRAPLEAVLVAQPFITRGAMVWNRIEQAKLPELDHADAPIVQGAAWKRLKVEGVTHEYRKERDDSTFTLGPIDLELAPGEIVFLVGGNGSGKTTFGKLLTGLYLPKAGSIQLDGVPIVDANRSWYREHFSCVFSDFYLFDWIPGTPSAERDEHARQYLQQLELSQKVQITNGIFSTLNLSTGQRKRLALLFAYLEDRPTYLFDEWASDQDPVFKNVFYNHILADIKRRGKTAIVISHDDHYFHVADRIVRLEDGRLLPEGTHLPVRADSEGKSAASIA